MRHLELSVSSKLPLWLWFLDMSCNIQYSFFPNSFFSALSKVVNTFDLNFSVEVNPHPTLPVAFEWAPLSSWMLLVARVTFVPLSPCQPGVWNRVTLPSVPQSENLATEEQRQKRGLWTWNDSPTLKCKTLLPQHSTGLLPPLICRKWLESETMSLTPSSQPLKPAQHAVSGQSGRESLLNRGISPRKAGFCLFLLQQAIIKQWGVNSFPPPCVPKCGPWSLTPILMRYFKLSHLTLGDLWVPLNGTWESKC